ncbi:cytochrome P450 family protein [Rhizoctonia solani]|uniref:Cytochrome P450 family protein n=1 Tax=Rhizoctonia solani TaxID=456999 RepID=A0A8H8NUF0_9AGAM|nr:cytochrome P450 family protein [Rhizoctonia solani]QRW18503.1 cytochrome P450 family protein [Rhizoctonia solani]
MPQSNGHVKFIELGKKLNTDMFSLTVLGKTTVVLNSRDDAINLLQNRSSVYSDRACPLMMTEPSLVNCADLTSFVGYNERWRKGRRLMHIQLNKQTGGSFHESQEREARLLLQRLISTVEQLDSSEKLYQEFFRTLSGTLMSSIYGYRVRDLDDPILKEVLRMVENLSTACMPTINVFPSLLYVPEWFPGAGWKKTAREWRIQYEDTVKGLFNWTKSRIDSGADEPPMVLSFLTEGEKLGLSGEELNDYVGKVAVTLFLGGAETTSNTFLCFVVAMVLYPDSQRKAQEEIDAILGTSRLPVLEDRLLLPYTDRLIQEVLRWCPALPLGIPHATTSEDIYQGFRIPKGAMVIGNTWAMSRDQKVYKNPEEFNPDRFLDPLVPPCPAFGFGRRECPGVHFAESSLFIVIASLLSAFSIHAGKDANGEDIVPKLSSKNALLFHPDEFRVKLEVRSVQHARLVHGGA